MTKKKIKKRVSAEQAIINKLQKEEDSASFVGITGVKIMRALQLRFGPQQLSMETIGSQHDKTEVNKKFYAGVFKIDISTKNMSPTEINTLWTGFKLKYFIFFSKGNSISDLIAEGMQIERAMELYKL